LKSTKWERKTKGGGPYISEKKLNSNEGKGGKIVQQCQKWCVLRRGQRGSRGKGGKKGGMKGPKVASEGTGESGKIVITQTAQGKDEKKKMFL